MRALIRFCVEHATTMALAVFCVVVFGMTSYVSLPRESSPDITIPVVMVTTPYVGVSPEDVEGLITIPLEAELASLRDVKSMKSTSAEGVSVVSIEFEPDVVIEDALQKVRDRVNKAKPKLPDDAEDPTVREISFSDIPVVLVTIAGGVDEQELKKLAEALQDDVTRVAGVLDAKISGGVEREIRVEVYPERLQHYGLAMHDVTGAIGNENVNIPGGTVPSGASTVLLRTPGEITAADQIEGIAIKRVGDRPVFIRDVARVADGFADRETYSRMNGQPSVTLAVTKRAGSNILEVASAVKELAKEHQQAWPDGVTHEILGDQSEGIEIMVTDLQNNIITALLLVVGVILFFMGARNSLFVASAIPLSMLMSFFVLEALGFTLNMIVLFSLILALGMLVDNAIVVVENVYRHLEMGKSRKEAAIEGTSEVAMAVAASTATTVAAFFPMVFWTGIMGEFMGFLPKTIIIVLIASLVVALTALPVVLSQSMKIPKVLVPDAGADDEDFAQLGPIMRGYKALLELSIRWRYLSFGLGIAALLFTFVAYALLNHGTEFFPDVDPERATVDIRMPEGTDVERTDQVVREVEAMLASEPNVDVWVAETGVAGGNGGPLMGSSASPNQARITVDFLPSKNTAKPGEKLRVEPTPLTITRLRERAAAIPGASVRVEKEEMGPPVGKPISVEVSGDDFHEVGEFALKVKRALAELDGTTDLQDDYRVGRPEMRLRIDRGAASRIGVSTAQIGNAVRTAVAGNTASTLREGDEETDIVVRLAPEYRADLQSVLDLRMPGRELTSPDTFPVPISSVASYTLAGGSGAIQHIDQDLVVTVSGDISEGYNENDVRNAVKALIKDFETPAGINLRLGGANDEQEAAVAFLGWAFAVAVALILMVLVTQFDSFAMPAIIMMTVLLSLIGVLWGLVITGTPFGVIMTGIGVISLAGVVVNNAIVLLDYVQQLQARGVSVNDSLIRAGITRFRPVMLTAITTTLGLVPMALGVSVDFARLRLVFGSSSAQWWGPMAVAVIFGLSFATLLTLVMVPTLYSIYDDMGRLWANVKSRFSPQPVADAVAKLLVLGVGLGVLASSAQAVTLDEAFRAAEDNNLDLAVLEEQTNQMGYQRGRAWSALSPRVTASASYIINEFAIELDMTEGFADLLPPGFEIPETDPVVVQEKTFWQADLTVTQRLFSGTALPALRGTYKLHAAAEESERRARQQIRVGVAQAFYGVLMARSGVELSESALKTAQGQLELAQRQVAAGMASKRALLQAQLAVAQAERDLEGAREQLVSAELSFARMTGLPSDSSLEMPPLHVTPESLDEAVADSQIHRPDVKAAEYQVTAYKHQEVGRALAWMPTVDAQFQYAYTENTGFQDDPTSWRLALVGTWNLWDGGLRIADQRDAASQRRVAEYREQLARIQAREDVRVAWESYQRASRALASVDTELDLAAENVRLAEAGFEAGSTTWLEVEQAQLVRRSTELAKLRERMNRDIAAMNLSVAVGTF